MCCTGIMDGGWMFRPVSNIEGDGKTMRGWFSVGVWTNQISGRALAPPIRSNGRLTSSRRTVTKFICRESWEPQKSYDRSNTKEARYFDRSLIVRWLWLVTVSRKFLRRRRTFFDNSIGKFSLKTGKNCNLFVFRFNILLEKERRTDIKNAHELIEDSGSDVHVDV